MRALWLTEHYPPGRGGMATSCDRIVHGLRRSGAAVDVIHLRPHARGIESHGRESGRDIVAPRGPDPTHALMALGARLERLAPAGGWTHVVAFGGILPVIAGPVYSAWLACPLVTLLRGNDFDTGVFAPLRRAALEHAAARSARVGCVTEDQRRRVALLFPGAVTAWTPNGIDTTEWQALPSDRALAHALRTGNVGPGRMVLGLFGDLKPKKGIEGLLDAIAAGNLGARLHLLVVGQPGEAFEARIQACAGLTVTQLPVVDRLELIPLMLACDGVAVPSLYDGFPNVVLEAAALGVPLFASDAGGAGVLADDSHGCVFAAGDRDACRDALVRLVESHAAARTRWGAAGIELAARFSAGREAERYLRLLDDCALEARPDASERGCPGADRQQA